MLQRDDLNQDRRRPDHRARIVAQPPTQMIRRDERHHLGRGVRSLHREEVAGPRDLERSGPRDPFTILPEESRGYSADAPLAITNTGRSTRPAGTRRDDPWRPGRCQPRWRAGRRVAPHHLPPPGRRRGNPRAPPGAIGRRPACPEVRRRRLPVGEAALAPSRRSMEPLEELVASSVGEHDRLDQHQP